MAALPPPIAAPVGAGAAPPTFQAASRAVMNALRTTPDPNPWRDNGATNRLTTALQTFITHWEAPTLQNNATYIHNLQCDIAIWGLRFWPITVNSDEMRDLVISYRFNYRKTGMPTTHPRARVARHISDRLLLLEAFEKAKDLGVTVISDYYGSKRMCILMDRWRSICSAFSAMLIECEWYRPLLTSKDRTDFTHLINTKWPSVTPAPGFIAVMTDIYCPPKTIVEELATAGCVLALFATQIFPKASIAGCHFDHMTYVQHNGVIHQAPGSKDHEWPHTYVNEEWVTYRGFHVNVNGPQTWEWDSWTVVEDYNLYRMMPTAGHLPLDKPFAPPTSPSSFIEEKMIQPARWSSQLQAWLADWFCRPTIFNRPLRVFLPALEQLSTKYVNKTRQAFQESNCQMEVGNIIDKKEYAAFWQNLRTNAGIRKEQIALETATYIFWGNLEEDYKMRRRTAESLGDTWRSFKDLKINLPHTPNTIPWPVIIAGTLSVALMFAYRKEMFGLMKHAVPSTKTAFGSTVTLPSILDSAKSLWHRTLDCFNTEPPSKIELQKLIPDESTIQNVKNGYEATRVMIATPETHQALVTIVAAAGGICLAPIWEEAFKAKLNIKGIPFGGILFGLLEGAAEGPWTLFKTVWHTYLNSLPNRVQAHHAWNTGCSIASLMLLPDSGIMGWIAKYMWPLHIYTIFSPHWRSNLNWAIGGFTMNYLLTKKALRFAAAGYVPPYVMVACLIGCVIWKCLAAYKPSPPNNDKLVAQFREDYADVQSHKEEYPKTMALTYQQATLPAITETQVYADSPIDPDIMAEEEQRPSVYVLLGTTSMMYRPYGFNQFYHAYKQRNVVSCLITPHCELPDDPCEPRSLYRTDCPIGEQWRKAANWTEELILSTRGNVDLQVVPTKSLEWIQHFNGAAKKQRAKDGIAQRNSGYLRKETNVFLKGDEVLYGREGFMKPRTVKALHPTVQATCYKEVGLCMDRLKIIFNQNQIHHIRSWAVTFSVGSGKTSSELNDWFMSSHHWVSLANKRAAIIVAGDDFFGIIRDNDKMQYLENDFAKFDRTQGVHAQDAEAQILRVLGMSDHISFLLFSTMNLQPRYENKRLQYQAIFHMPFQRATGAPDTTIGNTINNIISAVYVIKKRNSFDDMAALQARLGLEAKLQKHEDPSHATFLKGWWLPSADAFFWLPLPSQTIKMGKILTLPTQIFKHLDEDSAWRSAAKSMGSSYKNVPFEYPLFGPLLKRYAEMTGEVKELLEFSPNDAHKIVVDEKAEVDKYVARLYVSDRYSLTLEEIVEMEEELQRMPFPGLAVHNGWARVAARDYG